MWQRKIDVGIDRFSARAADVRFEVPTADLAPGRYLIDVGVEAAGLRQPLTRHVRITIDN